MFVSVPNPQVYDAESEGYKFCIKKTLVNESSLNCLKTIVEKRSLKMTEIQQNTLNAVKYLVYQYYHVS